MEIKMTLDTSCDDQKMGLGEERYVYENMQKAEDKD